MNLSEKSVQFQVKLRSFVVDESEGIILTLSAELLKYSQML